MILSKAARTPVDGAVVPPLAELRRVVGLGEGFAVALEDFVTVLGGGVGFVSTTRLRLDGEVVLELLFCANATLAPRSTIDRIIADLFIVNISSEKLATEALRHRD
jgi:hypothetical protein